MTAYCIIDVKHAMALCVSDGGLRHERLSESSRALWYLDSAGEPNTYFIRSAHSGAHLAAPDVAGGPIACKSDPHSAGTRWTFFPMHDGPGGALAVTIKDRRHNLAVVAADEADGFVYHDVPNGRMNAFWTLVAIDVDS
jgi:hypothetical protein